MSQRILRSHIQEESGRRAYWLSLLGHFLLFAFFSFAGFLLPEREPIRIGSGAGGGSSGDFVTVGLAEDVGGGADMYKPALTPRPEAVAPPPAAAQPDAAAEPETVPEDAFVERAQPVPTRAQTPPAATEEKAETARPAPARTQDVLPEARPGQIPTAPEPGKTGTAGGGAGAGGGMGSGRGLEVGSGSGEGQIDSWYIRQVEQRIGQNWLQTSLGELASPVEAIALFDVRPGGQVVNVRFEKTSGVRSVDLAVQRAILASTPLPPLPYELRGRSVSFQAVFRYPPR
ncbi:MAG TPA: TonB C-terminal domain-containing protein [Acidobacteriota bacterium]|nr:TonB C-terminal domain-containing protein [Acidobacteriota bacterium]